MYRVIVWSFISVGKGKCFKYRAEINLRRNGKPNPKEETHDNPLHLFKKPGGM